MAGVLGEGAGRLERCSRRRVHERGEGHVGKPSSAGDIGWQELLHQELQGAAQSLLLPQKEAALWHLDLGPQASRLGDNKPRPGWGTGASTRGSTCDEHMLLPQT